MCYFFILQRYKIITQFLQMGKLKKLKKLSLFRSSGVKGVKELRRYSYKQHALGPWCDVRHEQHRSVCFSTSTSMERVLTATDFCNI